MTPSLKRLSATLALCLLPLLASTQAHAYGAAGHKAVGDIAAELIKGSRAEKEVQRILGSTPLHDIAVWNDCVKGIDPASDFKYTVTGRYPECAVFENKPEEEALMRDYVKRNLDACGPKAGEESCHKQYHYTDETLQHGHYTRGSHGTSEHDIVGALAAAISRLQGGKVPAPFSLTNEREALALLVHLAGDIHQPLHVAAVYLDAEGKLIDPDLPGADPESNTVGGNAISITGGNLHGYWDNVPNRFTPADLAALPAAARAVAPSTGSLQQWPEAWANESIAEGAKLFEGVHFGPRLPGLRGPRWIATLPEGYDARALDQTREEVAKAGARLAQLLKAIWP
jgi:hypothetical protein